MTGYAPAPPRPGCIRSSLSVEARVAGTRYPDFLRPAEGWKPRAPGLVRRGPPFPDWTGGPLLASPFDKVARTPPRGATPRALCELPREAFRNSRPIRRVCPALRQRPGRAQPGLPVTVRCSPPKLQPPLDSAGRTCIEKPRGPELREGRPKAGLPSPSPPAGPTSREQLSKPHGSAGSTRDAPSRPHYYYYHYYYYH